MTQRIRAIAMDAFDTTLQPTIHIESPYQKLMTDIFPHLQQGTVKTTLRHAILTSPMDLEDVPGIAADLKIFTDNRVDLTVAMKNARGLLDKQLAPGAFKRNQDVDVVKMIAQQHGLQMGIISDLAQPYGVIVEQHLGDIRPHYLSYKTYETKREHDPFYRFSDDMNIDPSEIAYVGNHLDDDYRAAYQAGFQAFWYVPDKNAPWMEKHQNDLAVHEDDVVESLPEVFVKLKKRGFTLG